MPRFELHADFDHDGIISGTKAEAGLKLKPPGLILIPNLDADGRSPPRKAEAGKKVILDFERTSAREKDRELNEFVVHPTPEADGEGRLFVEVAGRAGFKVKLYEGRARGGKGRRLQNWGGGSTTTHVFELPVDSGRDQRLLLETDFLPGDPFCQEAAKPEFSNAEPRFRSSPFKDYDHALLGTDFALLRLVSWRPGGVVVVEDSALLSSTPLLFIDNTARAERLYVADIPEQAEVTEGNRPSVLEIQEAFSAIPGVELTIVPEEVNRQDGWLQDQFQRGFCHRPGLSPLPVVLHLPRARENVVSIAGKGNLAAFVAHHFPASDRGLYQRFWDRRFGEALDEEQRPQPISFTDSFELSQQTEAVWTAYGEAEKLLHSLLDAAENETTSLENQKRAAKCPEEAASIQRKIAELQRVAAGPRKTIAKIRDIMAGQSLFIGRARLKAIGSEVADHVAAAPPAGSSSTVNERAKMLKSRIKTALDSIRRPRDSGAPWDLQFTLSDNRIRRFTKDGIDRLALALPDIHDSVNFGGNLEVAPPTPQAPFGSIAFGTGVRGDQSLLRFLRAQLLQPLIPINTHWLGVGHVDEVMCFLPNKTRSGGFAVALASPGLAVRILRAALFLALEGQPAENPDDHDFRLSMPQRGAEEPRRGITLTRALRGKYWLHQKSGNGLQVLHPPELYAQLASFYNVGDIPQVDYNGDGQTHRYDASASVRELLHFAARSNLAIQDEPIEDMKEQLKANLPSALIAELPALFDPSPELEGEEAPDFDNVQTGALLPNVVNMQVVDGHVIVPKPYGPRMTMNNALTVLAQVLPAQHRATLSAGAVTRRGLDRNVHWAFAPIAPLNPALAEVEPAQRTDLARLARTFADGFGERPVFGERRAGAELDVDQILARNKTAILNANKRGLFGPGEALRKGWNRVVIPEPTVDLFQAYADVVLSGLGLTVHWVDSWYYHIRFGELHCGTNVIRRPGVKAPWWSDLSRFRDAVDTS